MYDVVIVGGGPAGLTAAIYLARAKFKCILLERYYYGGQISITEKVENYPGILEISGQELTETMYEQGKKFGAEYSLEEVTGIEINEESKIIKTAKRDIETKGVIIATGARPARVGFQGEDEYTGKGVSYCATCDARFFTGKELFVVGAGLFACQETLFLSKFAKKIYMIIRKEKFPFSNVLTTEIINNSKIQICFNSEITKVGGKDSVQSVTVKNNIDDYEKNFKATDKQGFGVFIFAGHVPESGLVKNLLETDDGNYIVTNNQKGTKIPGICAVGDVTAKEQREVMLVATDGAIAAKTMEKYLH